MTKTENRIKIAIIKAATTDVRTKLECRVSIGRSIIALQTLRGDTKERDKRPCYKHARKIVMGWLKAENITISDNSLQSCTYVALRLTDEDVAILASGNMQFCQVYSMLCVNREKVSVTRKYISDIAAGKQMNHTQWQKMRIAAALTNAGAGDSNRPKATNCVAGIARIDIMGNEEDDDWLDKIRCLLAAMGRCRIDLSMAEKWWKIAMKEAEKKRW